MSGCYGGEETEAGEGGVRIRGGGGAAGRSTRASLQNSTRYNGVEIKLKTWRSEFKLKNSSKDV